MWISNSRVVVLSYTFISQRELTILCTQSRSQHSTISISSPRIIVLIKDNRDGVLLLLRSLSPHALVVLQPAGIAEVHAAFASPPLRRLLDPALHALVGPDPGNGPPSFLEPGHLLHDGAGRGDHDGGCARRHGLRGMRGIAGCVIEGCGVPRVRSRGDGGGEGGADDRREEHAHWSAVIRKIDGGSKVRSKGG